MILLFKIQRKPFFFGVGKDRTLSIAAPINKYIFVPVQDLDKFKKFGVSELKALQETQDIVRSKESESDVKDYIISEIRKLQGKFVREVSVQEYKDWVEKL